MHSFLTHLSLAAPAFAISSAAIHARPPGKSSAVDRPPNVLLIVLDDVGYEKLRPFNTGLTQTQLDQLPETDALSGLRDQGILYSRMYANPVCSPTRACMLTGKYGAKTGMLTYLAGGGTDFTLLSTEVLLPAQLAGLGYRSGAFGKWHLSTDDGSATNNCHPTASGFERFRGHIGNNDAVGTTQCPTCNGHFAWRKLEREATDACAATDYTNSANVGTTWDARYTREQAAAWIGSVVAEDPDQPFFAYVAFNPPHESLQLPPLERVNGVVVNVKPATLTLLTQARIGSSVVNMLAQGSTYLPPNSTAVSALIACPSGPAPLPADDAGRLVYRANVEAVDWEIGQLLASIDAEALENTTVIVIGDNGTPEGVMDVDRVAPNGDGLTPPYAAGPPFPPFHGKRSLSEPGIRVPMIVAGASVTVGGPSAVYGQTVGAIDLWATIVDIAGGTVPATSDPQRESKTFKGSFSNLSATSNRRSAYSEIANVNGRAYTGTGLCNDVAAGCPTVTPANSPWSDLENGGNAICPPGTYQRSLVSWPFKYVRHVVNPGSGSTCTMPAYCSAAGPGNHEVEELFDVASDPNELNNLICSPPPTCNLNAMRAEVCRLSGP